MTLRGARFASALVVALLPLAAANAAPPKLIVQTILNPAIADAAKLQTLVDCVAVTPNGVAVVGNGDRLWAVGAAGAVPVAKIRKLSSFAFTPEGLLIGVRGRDLVYLRPGGALKTFFALPAKGMRIVPGRLDSFFLFGPEGKGGYGLYVLRPGRKISKVLRAPKPITSAAQAGGRILLVAGGALYGVSGHKLLLIAGEPNGTITSVAVDETGGRIFVSDGKHIFQVQKSQAMPLVGDLGGTLRW
ncbi:MAG: hypothetical protein ACREH9_07245, partial [Pseudomonadota bacterium]